MKSLTSKAWPILLIVFSVLIFFKPVFFENKLPIPADVIVGLYYPWRDFYVPNYPNGIPFKNFLITDPVRQQYVWRYLAIEQIKKFQLPLWNPYNFSGNPLLANFQTAVFYPLNIFFFILPFNFAWSVLVMLQPLLMGIFLYLYLRNLKLNQWASLIGGISFAFSGFSIAWLEWNTIGHVALWLPLILLSIDKLFFLFRESKIYNLKSKNFFLWSTVFLFSLCSSFFAGHLQIFLYVSIFSLIYFLIRWWVQGRKKKIIIIFTFYFLLFTLITAVQWLPTLQLINLSARNFDLPNWQVSSWFLPWQNLVQFIAPDFFGNPATLNYWGEWNYGEFIGYIGILPLFFAFLAILWRRDWKTRLATLAVLVSLSFMLPTASAKLPYQLSIPFLSTLQPTRLMVIVDFCLAVLVALGIDYFLNCSNDSKRLNRIIKTIFIFGMVFAGLWIYVVFGQNLSGDVSLENLTIAKRNLILPTILFLVFAVTLLIYDILIYHIRNKNFLYGIRKIILMGIIGLVIFDFFRFGWKFTPFTDAKFLFPQTETIKFLQNQPRPFRIMTTANQLFPPNFSSFYKIEDVSGYDPLYLKNYGELIAAWYRNKPDISPFSFNRALTPQDYPSKMADLLNVKYVVSIKDEVSPKLKLVFQEGLMRVYENKKALPRVFWVENIKWVDNKQEAINEMFKKDFNPLKTAVVENIQGVLSATPLRCEGCSVNILVYSENKIILKAENQNAGFLALTDIDYPTWKARIDNQETKIYLTDYAFRGIVIPKGKHLIEFYINLF